MHRSITRRTFAKGGIAVAAALIATAGSLPVTSAPTWAETWPSKPIKIICAYPAGGLADAFARTYGDYLSQKLGQPVIVENRAGATGSVGALAAKQSSPDGHTLLIAINATLAQTVSSIRACLTIPTGISFSFPACLRGICRSWPARRPAQPT